MTPKIEINCLRYDYWGSTLTGRKRGRSGFPIRQILLLLRLYVLMGRYLNVLGVMAVSHSTKVLWMRTGRPLQRVTPNLHHNRKTNGAPGKRTNLCKSLPQRTVSVADIAAPCNGSKYPRSKFSIKRCITPNHHRICYHGLLS